MLLRSLPVLAAALLVAGPAVAQGHASIGRSSAVVHGQSWNAGQQDLSGFNTGSNGRPTTRTQVLRQRAAAAQAQQGGEEQAAQPRRAAQHRVRGVAANASRN